MKGSLIQYTRCDATKNSSYHARSFPEASDKNSSANGKCDALSVLILAIINTRQHLVIVLEPATDWFGDIEKGEEGMWV